MIRPFQAIVVRLVAFEILCGPAAAMASGSDAGERFDPAFAPVMTPVGHGGIEYFNPAQKRFSGSVKAVGTADAKGRILSFKLVPVGPGSSPPAPGSMVGWRLTMLAGKRYASAFEVRSNTETEVVVVPRGSSLKGIAANDVFVVEEPDPQSPWADDLRFDHSPS